MNYYEGESIDSIYDADPEDWWRSETSNFDCPTGAISSAHLATCARCRAKKALSRVEERVMNQEHGELNRRRGQSRRSIGRPRAGSSSKRIRKSGPRVLHGRRINPTSRRNNFGRPSFSPRIYGRPVRRKPIRRSRRPSMVVNSAPVPCVCPAHGTEFVRWVQSSLNQVSGLNLALDGVMSRATRQALRDFQKTEGIPIDGIAGPETEQSLIGAKSRLPGRSRPRANEHESQMAEYGFNQILKNPSPDAQMASEEFEFELGASALASAVSYNRESAKNLKWLQHRSAIVSKLLFLNHTPSDESFAQHVAAWQSRKGLGDDGKIGPQTWKKMQPLLGLKSSSKEKNHRVGPLAVIDTRMPDPMGGQYRLNQVSKSRGEQYGIRQTISALLYIAEVWHTLHPEYLIGIGDISLNGGGYLAPHKSHRLGLDVDLALFERATNKRISRTNMPSRYQPIVHEFLELADSNPILCIKQMFYFDHGLHKKIPGTATSKAHYRHIHIRFCRPPSLKSKLDSRKVGKNVDRLYQCAKANELPEPELDKFSNDDYAMENYLDQLGPSEWSETYGESSQLQWAEDNLIEDELSGSKLKSAINYNRKNAKDVGWFFHFDDIASNILKLNVSPTEKLLAIEVAYWQSTNGLSDDGKIGPNTWKKMRLLLGLPSGSSSANPAESKRQRVAEFIEANREKFGILWNDDIDAAKIWGGNHKRLRVLIPQEINLALQNMGKFDAHLRESQALFAKTKPRKLNSGKDMHLVLALATREGGNKGTFRTETTRVVSAGTDTHPDGVSGLDFLYSSRNFFREAGIPLELVPRSELQKQPRSQPARLQAKHLLFAHMAEVTRRENSFWLKFIRNALREAGIKPDDVNYFYGRMNVHARRTWSALTYPANKHRQAAVKYLISYHQSRGDDMDFNEIMSNPFSGVHRSTRRRIFAARATALRAYAFDQFR